MPVTPPLRVTSGHFGRRATRPLAAQRRLLGEPLKPEKKPDYPGGVPVLLPGFTPVQDSRPVRRRSPTLPRRLIGVTPFNLRKDRFRRARRTRADYPVTTGWSR